MKHLVFLFSAYFMVSNCLSQSQIKGNVYYLNSGKKSATGVEISAKGSNTAYSKSDGSYTLHFANSEPGTRVFIEIGNWLVIDNKNTIEIELVNSKKLEIVNTPKDPTKNPLHIIVCPKGSRDIAARKYYKIIRTSADRVLEKKKIELLNSKKELGYLNKTVLKLQEDYERYQKQFSDTIRTYKEALAVASINRDNASQRVKDYLDALDNGLLIEEARKELNTRKAFEEANNAKERILASIEEIEQDAKSMIALFRFPEALQKYDSISLILQNKKYDPILLVNNLYVSGELSQEQLYDSKAISNYTKALKILDDYQNYDNKKAAILNNLGVNLHKTNRHKDAEEHLLRALKLNRKLVQTNPTMYTPLLANVLNNLGLLYQDINQYDKAEKSHKEALAIYHSLPHSNQNNFTLDIASTQHNLGMLYSGLNQYKKAENIYLETLALYKTLTASNTHEAAIATTNSNLGNVYSKSNQNVLAEKYYLNALKINKKLSSNNEQRYLKEVAMNSNNLGVLYRINAKYDKAEIFLTETLNIYKQLTDKNKTRYINFLANSYKNLANLYYITDQFERSETNYVKGLKITRELVRDNPVRFNTELANSLNDLGLLYIRTKEADKAEKMYKEALDINRSLRNVNPKKYDIEVATNLKNLGLLYLSISYLDKAETVLTESLQIFKKRAATNPKVHNLDVAGAYGALAFLRYSQFEKTRESKYKQEMNALLTKSKEALKIFASDNASKKAIVKMIQILEKQ